MSRRPSVGSDDVDEPLTAAAVRDLMIHAEAAARGRADAFLSIDMGHPSPPNGGGRGAASEEPDRGRDHVDRLEAAMRLLPNDTDTARRLIHWRGGDLIFVRDVGWHSWTGSFWDPLGGAEAAQRLAQQVARWIGAESLVMRPSEEEEFAIEGGRVARAVPKDARGPAEELAIAEGTKALAAFHLLRQWRSYHSDADAGCSAPHRRSGADGCRPDAAQPRERHAGL